LHDSSGFHVELKWSCMHHASESQPFQQQAQHHPVIQHGLIPKKRVFDNLRSPSRQRWPRHATRTTAGEIFTRVVYTESRNGMKDDTVPCLSEISLSVTGSERRFGDYSTPRPHGLRQKQPENRNEFQPPYSPVLGMEHILTTPSLYLRICLS
jgi:hypothetical protein